MVAIGLIELTAGPGLYGIRMKAVFGIGDGGPMPEALRVTLIVRT
jgi:hypothetical protein